jgi:hypothetical protein
MQDCGPIWIEYQAQSVSRDIFCRVQFILDLMNNGMICITCELIGVLEASMSLHNA